MEAMGIRAGFGKLGLVVGLGMLIGCSERVPIQWHGFEDGIHHYQSRMDGVPYDRYSEDDYLAVAENLLLMQRDNGGWHENEDPFRVMSAEERERWLSERGLEDTSFDNNNTYTQVAYLFEAYERCGDELYREAALRGLSFILNQQTETGGWTHSPPLNRGWRGYITFADDVIPGILQCLRRVSDAQYPFGSVDSATRERAAEAVKRGEELILKLQIRQGETLALWAGQYDAVSLEPRGARTFELPAIVVRESVSTLRYLMTIEEPSVEVIQAVEGGVAWLRRHAIHGLRIDTVDAPRERWMYHAADFDRVEVADADAPRIWARFYEMDSNRPFMANRDGVKVFQLAEVKRERRTGYEWYGYWPEVLLEEDYPKWKAVRVSE